MLSYMFGGGHTRAESCDACALVFFERGELAAVLEEARSGIKLDETTRTRLHGHQVLWTWDRFARADTAVIVAALIGLAGFVQMTRRGRTDIFLAAAISLLLYAVYRWRAERARTAAAEQLNRLVASEAASSAAAKAPAGPWAPSAGPVALCPRTRVIAACATATLVEMLTTTRKGKTPPALGRWRLVNSQPARCRQKRELYGPPLRSSVSTSLATCFKVSNTPCPERAHAPKSGTFVGLSSSRSSSSVAMSGISRLLYCMTKGILSSE
jgi:hypothetical protein